VFHRERLAGVYLRLQKFVSINRKLHTDSLNVNFELNELSSDYDGGANSNRKKAPYRTSTLQEPNIVRAPIILDIIHTASWRQMVLTREGSWACGRSPSSKPRKKNLQSFNLGQAPN